MNIDRQDCSTLPLAASDVGNVTVCPNCNVITLTVHSLSIRFDPPTFDQLAGMIGQARAVLLRPKFGFPAANRDVVDVAQPGPESEPRH